MLSDKEQTIVFDERIMAICRCGQELLELEVYFKNSFEHRCDSAAIIGQLDQLTELHRLLYLEE